MTIDATDVARFRELVRQMEALVAGPAPRAAVDPDGLPGQVAAGELIESAWGNAVSDSVRFNRKHLPSAHGAAIALSAGWGTGLRAIGSFAIGAIGADMPNQVTMMVLASYTCTGAAGSGADYTGATTRSRFRLQPGADAGISYLRTATSDQQVIVDTFQTNRTVGAAASTFEIWAETSKNCNITGSALAWYVPGGVDYD